MSMNLKLVAVAVCAIMTASCASEPLGPSVAVMPGAYKPFEAFKQDQLACKQYASQQIAGGVAQANDRAISAGIIGTALGALIGGAQGYRHSTGVGAATGAAIGTAIGAGQSGNAQYSLQNIYDASFSQCMYAKGNQVPGYSAQGVPPPRQG
ncbi:MAG TPA: hypothetical protein VG735_16200 [Caulobacterales bacterium]|nr:hypothetical protein [Caulobacterales bacterium]